MQEIDSNIFLIVIFGSIALLILTVGFIIAIITSKQKELRLRKRQLEELEISEKKYRNLFEYSPAGMVRLNSDWKIVDANEALSNIVKTKSFEDANKVLLSLPAADKIYINDKLNSEGNIKDYETVILSNDGTELWISISATITKEKFLEAVIIDISKRRQAEEQIREQARLLDQARDAIFVTNLDGVIKYWNKGAERLYQYTSDETEGKNIADIIYKPEQLTSFKNAIEHTTQNLEWVGILNQKKRDESIIITHCRWTIVKNFNNEPIGILQVCSDITELKRLEAHFLKAQRLESIGIFASGIAHDLSNALSPVLIGLNVLKRKLQDQQSIRLLKALESSVKYGTEMVYRVLSFVKGVKGDPIILNTRKLIKDVTNHLNQLIPDSISLQTRMTENLPNIEGDPTQLQQVLINLCVNARDAMPNGGELTFNVKNMYVDHVMASNNPDAKEGEYVGFSISDTGLGIPLKDVHKIFEPFYTTKEIGKGTGLGLSITQGIIKGHKGFMTVDSIVGKGSTFSVYIPIAQDRTEASDREKRLSDIQKKIIFVIISEDEYSQEFIEDLEKNDYDVILAAGKEELSRALIQNCEKVKTIIFDGIQNNITPELIEFVSNNYPQMQTLLIAKDHEAEKMDPSLTNKIQTILIHPVSHKQLLQIVQ